MHAFKSRLFVNLDRPGHPGIVYPLQIFRHKRGAMQPDDLVRPADPKLMNLAALFRVVPCQIRVVYRTEDEHASLSY